MKIKINSNDVFRYVVGNTSKDPIESCIDFDNRYEVMDFGIFDHAKKVLIKQGEGFNKFSSSVSSLRSSYSSFDRETLISKCESLCGDLVEVNLGE